MATRSATAIPFPELLLVAAAVAAVFGVAGAAHAFIGGLEVSLRHVAITISPLVWVGLGAVLVGVGLLVIGLALLFA